MFNAHMFHCDVLVDVSEQSLAFCKNKYRIGKTFTTVCVADECIQPRAELTRREGMLEACPEVEVVFVGTSE